MAGPTWTTGPRRAARDAPPKTRQKSGASVPVGASSCSPRLLRAPSSRKKVTETDTRARAPPSLSIPRTYHHCVYQHFFFIARSETRSRQRVVVVVVARPRSTFARQPSDRGPRAPRLGRLLRRTYARIAKPRTRTARRTRTFDIVRIRDT